MTTITVGIYESNPGAYGLPNNTSSFVFSGPASPTGTATITDNGAGASSLTLEDHMSGEDATADVTVAGQTSTGSWVSSDTTWLIRDTVTGEEFVVVQFKVGTGDAVGNYTLSEKPLIPGRTYDTLSRTNIADAESGDAVFTYADYICYASGTLIDTQDGPRAVETLRPGDLVMTVDHGPQPVRWVRCSDHPLEEAEVDDKPVLIAAGTLGGKLPAQDLIVSPQHRVLVGGHGQLQGQFETEAFAPAKSLTKLRGIRHMKGKTKITWVHFACDRHEIVTANGCLSESLLLGPMVVNGLTAAERQTVIDIFGPAATPDAALNGPPALECLKVGAARQQLAKSLEEKGLGVAKEITKWDVGAAMERYEAERLREADPKSQIRMKRVA